MKKSISFILLVFGLSLAKSSFGQCEKIFAVNNVKILDCGQIQFKYKIEKGNGAIQFEWFIDNHILMNNNDFTLKYSGKRWIPYTIHIWNDCSDFKQYDSIFINYEQVSVMAAHELQNCTDAKFHFISSNQNQLPQFYEWSGDDGFLKTNEWEPTHTYPGPGTYKYTLKYLAEGACDYSYFHGVVTIKNTATAIAGDDKTLCMYNGEQLLSGIPVGGTWSGNGVDGNAFDPQKAGVGKHELLYTTHENQCEAKDKVIFTVKDINPDFTADVVEGIAPLVVNFNSKLNNNQFVSWDFGDANSSTLNNSNLPNPLHIYTEPGLYNVILKIDDFETGCSGERIYKKLIRVSEKNQHNIIINRGLAIYPNPTKGEFKFVVEKDQNVNYNIDIITLNGQLVTSSGYMSLATTEMNLSNLPSGMYLVRVKMDNGKALTGKLVLMN
ncbi:MAG: T9SS type A sorting domain-containing protein [Bacteroidota bacterium]|nr:T9SS type A sorting domain-containing protein [Bacteroidota bacterium]